MPGSTFPFDGVARNPVRQDLTAACPGRIIHALTLLCLTWSLPRHALAEDLRVNVGVTGWANSWNSWFINHAYAAGPSGAGAIQLSDTVNSSVRVTATPQIGLYYGNLYISGTWLAKQTYSLTGPLESLSASRSELDAKIGYYFFSNLALTVGYKELRQDYGSGTYRWRGPTLALLGSAPLGDTGLALYGVYGYGPLRLKLPAGQTDFAGQTSFNANYSLAEIGISYGRGVRFVKSLRLTLGYRFQLLTTRDYRLESLTGSVPSDEHDITQGLTLGLSATL